MSDLTPTATTPCRILTNERLLGVGAAHGRHSVSMLPYARDVEAATIEAVLEKMQAVIESVAQDWDGCSHDDICGAVDIGWAIRQLTQRRLANLLKAAAVGQDPDTVEATQTPAKPSKARCPFCGSHDVKEVMAGGNKVLVPRF